MFEEFMGTMPVAERQKFDLAALADYMRVHVDGFDSKPALQIEQFKGGQSNPTFKLRAGEQSFVLRTKPGPVAKLLPSAHAIEREFKVMNALNKAGFPAARQYALCTDEEVIGRAFYIMEFVDGRVLWDQSLPGMSPTERGEIYDEMNRVIATLHNIDFAAIGLADYGKPGNYFARQIDRWTKQYRASETEPIAAMDKLIEWLPQHIPAGDDTSIVHGDYRLDNMMFHPSEPRVLALLDWELSTLGHPLADFSYHCMSWHVTPGQFRGIAGLDHQALGIPNEQDYIAKYCARTGKTIRPEDFNFYLAYNLFRMAGILQGIMKRYVDGTASSAQAKKSGAAARPMAELGWSYVLKTLG
ncbi:MULTISPECIES: phosphotransferase [unclassified Undibacterium]|uniref:phosphotransferase n=1 Tax=unclassified Undibacterium TaxID=2630295 RepID=UPI002AC93BC7|nr:MULTISPECIES: phosphotransferase [unclassified Undibacterium]MEB0140954.1 phosphotransferase [Undibacterium sp. CCC2.1]MEB0173339.1 phosphotransferase [Undibacterium sp. CCC1.1]MEB0177910.1 phosphotransferase [Undibacterium sp. CCC3.4]MEB0217158.1 phosphotransferase [Undibacterium sp. 5I2]WPX43103.1 phosphotransferase [Undibacterium sp. CCC3.4]